MTQGNENEALRAALPSDSSLGQCLFCQHPLSWQTDDIDGWIAHLYCVGCDFLSAMSEWKYGDVEDAKADAWARWTAVTKLLTQPQGDAAGGAEAMREACAKVAEELYLSGGWREFDRGAGRGIATAIRNLPLPAPADDDLTAVYMAGRYDGQKATPADDGCERMREALQRTASGETWHGIPVIAYHWQEPSGFSPPSSTEIDRVAYHWSTGPKDAEPLVRLSDVCAALQSPKGGEGAEYKPGDLVEKHEGYPFGKGDAVILAAYRCASGTGPWRYVVEHPEGWQHIFSGKQLRRAPEQGREDGK